MPLTFAEYLPVKKEKSSRKPRSIYASEPTNMHGQNFPSRLRLPSYDRPSFVLLLLQKLLSTRFAACMCIQAKAIQQFTAAHIIYPRNAKECLAEWLRHSSGTPHVLSSNPSGSEFQAVIKKIPSPVPCVKALI
jgi:hypothetical protein